MAAGKAVAVLAKPQLRNLLHNSIKKHIIIAGIVAASTGVAVKTLVNDRRKAAYAEFYK